MPIAERDYMRVEPGNSPSPKEKPPKNRRGILFRILIVGWLTYLTVHTHNMENVTERAIEIAYGINEAGGDFILRVKNLVVDGSDSPQENDEVQ